MARIEIVLADLQPSFVEEMCERLRTAQDIEIVGTATSQAEALAQIQLLKPDIAMIPVLFNDGSGLTLLGTVGNQVNIMFLTAEASEDIIVEAMLNGARGYILKWGLRYGRQIDIARAIRQVHAGQIFIDDDSLTTYIAATRRRLIDKHKYGPLTARQFQVLQLLAQGLSPDAIAARTGLSPNTVRSHTRGIALRLGVRGKQAMLDEAARQGLIKEPHATLRTSQSDPAAPEPPHRSPE